MSSAKTCIEKVWVGSTWRPTEQPCGRKAGLGPGGNYCKQHSKKHSDDATPIETWYDGQGDPVQVVWKTATRIGIKNRYGFNKNGLDEFKVYDHPRNTYWPTRLEALRAKRDEFWRMHEELARRATHVKELLNTAQAKLEDEQKGRAK